MARCSSSFTAQYTSDYSSTRPSNRYQGVTSSSVRREQSKTRVFSTASRYSNLADRGEVEYGGQDYEVAALAENSRMDNEVAKLRDVIRTVEHKFQNVQADLTNLSVELKKFRNLNKLYKRSLKRQHDINQRTRWRLFEAEQENETLRQLVKTLRASREMEFGAARNYLSPGVVEYAGGVSKASRPVTPSVKSPRHTADSSSKSYRSSSAYHDTCARTSPSAGHAHADLGHVTGYRSAQGQGHSSYSPRTSSHRSTVERTSSATRRDYTAGHSTSFDYESRETECDTRDTHSGNRSSKKSSYRTSSYTKFD